MKIDDCLITAAGYGSRMGEIGKLVPKPLWPIFEKTLLDLQLSYLKQFTPKRIFMNAYHLKDEIISWAKDKDVIILEEDPILGSGGCVHNLKQKYPDVDDLLIINSDQFFFFKKDFIIEAINTAKKKDAVGYLLGINVDKNEKYNETIIKDGALKEIRKKNHDLDFNTYSGVGFIRLSKINYKEGISSFFDTVCDFKNSLVLMGVPEDYEFWDFGTKDKYIKNSFEVLNRKDSQMYKFLVDNNALKEKSVTNSGYNCEGKGINLTDHNLKLCNSIVLSSDGKNKEYRDVIVFDNTIDHF